MHDASLTVLRAKQNMYMQEYEAGKYGHATYCLSDT